MVIFCGLGYSQTKNKLSYQKNVNRYDCKLFKNSVYYKKIGISVLNEQPIFMKFDRRDVYFNIEVKINEQQYLQNLSLIINQKGLGIIFNI